MVISTIERQAESDWSLLYSAERMTDAPNRFAAVLHCATHLNHYIGQINFLSRELTKS